MTMRKKILAGFLGMLLLTCGVGYIGYSSTEYMARQSTQATQMNNSLKDMFNAQGAQLRFALYSQDEYIKRFAERLKSAADGAATAKLYMDIPARLAETDRYIGALSTYQNLFEDLTRFEAQRVESKKDLRAALGVLEQKMLELSNTIRESSADRLTQRAFEAQQKSLTLRNDVTSLRLGMALFESEPSRERGDALSKNFQAVQNDLKKLSGELAMESTQALARQAEESFHSVDQHLTSFIQAMLQRMEALAEIRELVRTTEAQVTSLAQQAVKSMETASSDADTQLIISIALALLFGVLVSWLITCNVHAQLGKDPAELRDIARRVTDGDYAVDDGSPRTGVYGYLVSMVKALEGHIEQAQSQSARAAEETRIAQEAMKKAEIASTEAQSKTQAMLLAADKLEEVAHTVSSASAELSAQIEQSERGAAEQAARVTETATAMEEMNSTVAEVAQNAGRASEVSASTRQKADNGSEIVKKAVESIWQVQQESLALKTDMATLSEHAQSITQIMSVISDIADQTNLLALNAAIEAARAGEAGRGFAVVADEVRKLAEKTMASTADVGNAIQAIQTSASKSMTQVDRAVKVIQEATELANESGTALQEIVNMADNTADQVRAIATASEQQSASSEEINRSISQVNAIAGDTAQAMVEAARAVSDLANQAQVLSGLIEDMKRG